MESNGSVAIVDDEVDLVRTYELILKKRHIPMSFTAYNGEDAIYKFKKADPRPRIVIIDYRLPDMSGLDVMIEILSLEPKTRIVIISGDQSIMQESLDAGATAFMKKPAAINEITETLNSLMTT